MMNFWRIVILIFLVFSSRFSQAGEVEMNSRLDGTNLHVPNSSLFVKYDKFSSLPFPVINPPITINNSTGLIEFGVDETKKIYHSTEFTSVITFTYITKDFNLTTSSPIVQTLITNYHPTQTYKGQAFLKLNNVSYIEIIKYQILSYQNYGTSGQVLLPSNPNDLYLESTIKVDETVTFDFLTPLPTATQMTLQPLVITATNTMEIQAAWDYIPGAETYELEWIYLDDYDASAYTALKPNSQIFYDFRYDATRVTTTNQYYNIPMVYERGWIIFRVRGVGRSETNNNIRLEGTWSNAGFESGNLSTFLAFTPNTSNSYRITKAHEADNLNWTCTRTFAEDGKSGIGVSYEDGLMKNRQSVARLNTERKVIAQSTLYDWHGRPTISVLPTPINEDYLGYKSNLNIAPGGAQYDKAIFDNITVLTNTCFAQGQSMDPNLSTGAARYYSTVNIDKEAQQAMVPDAMGKPFVQVEYYPDQTGRIKKQSLPGNTHFVGSGREQQFFYVQPTQEELVRIFGTEVGLNDEYEKLIETDPNGQSSVSYIDGEGRTVATALYGASPNNLLAISDATNPAQSFTTTLTNNANDPNNQSYVLNNTFFGQQGETHEIFYDVTASQFSDVCLPNICMDCIYELELSVVDDCNNEMLDSDPLTPGNQPFSKILGRYNPTATPQFNTSCPGNPALLSFQLNNPSPPYAFNIPKTGNYHIKKVLKLSTKPLTEYASEFVKSNTCITTLSQFQNTALSQIDIDACTSDCATCSTAVMSIASSLTPQQVQDMIDRCKLKCDMQDVCKSREKLLLMHFKPGGYFAKYDASKPNLTPTPADPLYAYSIFNSSNSLSTIVNIPSNSWYAIPPGSYGTYTTIDPATNLPVAPSALTVPNYVASYTDNFAKPWLQWHPEYCKLQFYCDPMIKAITNYSNTVFNINSFDEACKQGYLFPVTAASGWQNAPNASSCPSCGPVTNNYIPLITTVGSGFNSTQIATALANLTSSLNATTYTAPGGNVTANIYQYAIGVGSNLPINDITTSVINPVFGVDNCYRDRQWEFYKRFLLNFVTNLIADLQTQFVSSWNSNSGGCVNNAGLTALPGYVKVFPDLVVTNNPIVSGFSMPSSSSGPLTSPTPAFVAQCATFCSSYVNNWMTELGPCNITSAHWPLIKTALEDVCKAGCDANDPFGASNTLTGITINGPSGPISGILNFQDVLTAFGYGPNASCNSYLVTAPKPKGYSFSGTATTAPKLDACGCDAILNAHHSYTTGVSNSTINNCTTTESSYFQTALGATITNVGSYVCACQTASLSTGGYNFNNVPAEQLAGLALPANLSCQNCIDCNQLAPAITKYNATFGSIPYSSLSPQLLENFFNAELNMNNTASEWIDFINDCDNNSNNDPVAPVFGSASGITSLSTTQVKDLGPLLNILYTNGFLTAGSYVLNTSNAPGFFGSSIWPNANSWSPAYAATVPNTVNVTTSISSNSISITLDNSPNTTNIYNCSFILVVPPTFPTSPTLNPGLPSAGFFDIKGACGLGFDEDGTTLINKPESYVVSFSYQNSASTTLTFTFTGTSACFKTLAQPLMPAGTPSCTPYLCSNNLSLTTPTNNCIATLINNALNSASTNYSVYIAQQVAQFIQNYKNYCYANVTETTKRGFSIKEYHYTLYYYDRAGNLVHTVPPASVQVISNATTINNAVLYVKSIGTAGSVVYPTHSLNDPSGIDSYVSHYQYNTFDAPLVQVTPDGGETNYLYDHVGRLVASRNRKQLSENTWSYTLYDQFGRITEVGVVKLNPGDVLTESITQNPIAWPAFVSSRSRQEVTQSFYDVPAIPALNLQFAGGQQNLRNRVSSSTYEWTFDNNPNTYDYATAYSYDDHGNATHIVQQNPKLNYAGPLNEYKHIEYEFDLISGNVNKVIFQRGERDQYFHKYFYDSDNRLHEVHTSNNGIVYQNDAKYFYFQHGPLARTEIGEKQVQATDYAFTIQGWVKGINSNLLNESTDIGKDGEKGNNYMAGANNTDIHADFAKDASSYSLNYFNGDYNPIKSAAQNFLADMSNLNSASATGFKLSADAPDLYNGNISSMVTSIYEIRPAALGTTDRGLVKPQVTGYRYDQLQRIKNMKAYSSLKINATGVLAAQYSEAINLQTNQWLTPVNGSNYVGIYEMDFEYDKIGNITNLRRAGDATYTGTNWARNRMDILTYNYNTTAGIFVPSLGKTINVNSQLTSVNDATVSAYGNDIDNQVANNYNYNGIGSLQSDISEQIQLIEWTDAHKVKSVIRTTGSTRPDVYFEYDAFGRRISKKVVGKTPTGLVDPNNIITTYYTLDAEGNPLAIYTEQITTGPLPTTNLICSEQLIYGSGRLGLNNAGIDMYNPIIPNDYVDIYFGKKNYECTNHLGNVLTTITDRKRAIDGTYAYVGNANGSYVSTGYQFTNVGAGLGYYNQLTAPDGTVDYYMPEIETVNDYYAFGMVMPGRSHAVGGAAYRYGMNGQEKENEVFEGANSAEYWMYDSRLGRRWENDPISYPWQSPYAAFNNNPIYYSDPTGLEGEGGDERDGAAGPARSPSGGPNQGDIAGAPDKNSNPGGNKQGDLAGNNGNDQNKKGGDQKPTASTPPSGGGASGGRNTGGGSNSGGGTKSGGKISLGNTNLEIINYNPYPPQLRFKYFMQGLTNAVMSDAAFGIGRKDPREISKDPMLQSFYAMGQMGGDIMAIGAGDAEIGAGLNGLGISAGLGATGVGAVPAAFAALGSAIVVAHGTSVVSVATAGLIKTSTILNSINHHNGNDAASNTGGGDNRIKNPSKNESPVWKKLGQGKNGRKTVGKGKKKRYFEWDHTHNDIEVYDSNGNHLGSMNPTNGKMYKPAVKGRKINLK